MQRHVIPSFVRQTSSRRKASGGLGVTEQLEARTMLSAYLVTNSADDGSAGTLRDAIKQVNLGNFSQIDFAFSTPTTITVTSALDKVTHSVLINGPKDASGNAMVTLRGNGSVLNGLVIDAAGVTVQNLSIGGFSGAGVVLEQGGGDTLQGNYIGLDHSGAVAMGNSTGVSVLTGNNMLVGNVISGNWMDGVDVTGDGNTLQGNLIGTDVTATVAVGNGNSGVVVDHATNTLIGGATSNLRNLISGNNFDGVTFTNDTGPGNLLQGNFIGTDVTGLVPLGNFAQGVDLGTSNGLAVSNLSVLNNVISGNSGNGIYVRGGTNNTIQGNYIGTDATGHAGTFDPALFAFVTGNMGDGIRLLSGSTGNLISANVLSGNWGSGVGAMAGANTSNTVQGNLIGVDISHVSDGNGGAAGINVRTGSVFASGNTISANFGNGVEVDSSGSVFVGNYIGTDASFATGLGNAGDGIYIIGSNNVFGGTAAGAGNVIAYNAVAGVFVYSSSGNAIRGNSIFSNAALGIALGSETVVLPNNSTSTPASNNNQNYPVLTSVTGFTGGSITAGGTFQGLPNTTYALDFFANPAADPSNYGPGKTYIGSYSVTTDASGNANFNATFPSAPAGQLVWSATATDPNGNTSEFSMDATAVISTPQKSSTSLGLSSSLNPAAFGQQVTFTAAVTPAGGTAPVTGTVSFIVNNTVMQVVPLNGSTSANWTTIFAVGATGVTAVYSGDSNYTGSQASLTQTVNQAATATALTSAMNPSTFGQALIFTATVTPASGNVALTGTISFMVNNVVMKTVTLSGGNTASWTTTLAGGNTSVTASYSGDGNYAPSQQTLTQAVKQAASTMTAGSSLTPSTSGQAVVFQANVSCNASGSTPTGNVTFIDNGVVLATVPLEASGAASVSTSALSPGSHKIAVEYSGDGNFAASSATLTQVVNTTVTTATISGHTCVDTTGDGLTADDKALAGVTVLLFRDKNADGIWNVLDGLPVKSTVSDASGTYKFDGLSAGKYFVLEITPVGYVRTTPKPLIYYTDVLTSGLVINNNDFDNRKVGRPLPPVIVETPHKDEKGGKGIDIGHGKKK